MEKSEKQISLVRSIIKNSSVILWVKIFLPISYFIITLSIARLLSVKDFGNFAIVFSYYGIFRIFAIFGIDTYLMREVAKKPEKADVYLGNAYIIGIGLAFANILAMNLVFMLAGYSAELRTIGFVISLIFLSEPIIRYSESVFICLGKAKYIFYSVLIRETTRIILVMSVLLFYKNLLYTSIGLLVSWYLGAVLNIIFVRRYLFRPRLSFHAEIFSDMFRTSFVIALIGGFSSLFLATDIIVLSKIKGGYDVGLYSAAYKFITLAFLFIDALGTGILPVISQVFKESSEEFKKISETTLKLFTTATLFFIITIFFFSSKLLVLIFGSKFLASSGILSFLIWVPLFLGGSYLLAKMLFVADMQRYDLFSLGIACIVNLVLNIPLTIYYGAEGTAIATLVSTLILFVMHIWFFYKKIFILDMREVFLKPLLSGVIFFASFFFCMRINLYLGFVISLSIYIYSLVALKVIKKEESAIFKRICFGSG